MRASQGWVYLKEQELRGWRAQGVVLGYARGHAGQRGRLGEAGEAAGWLGGRSSTEAAVLGLRWVRSWVRPTRGAGPLLPSHIPAPATLPSSSSPRWLLSGLQGPISSLTGPATPLPLPGTAGNVRRHLCLSQLEGVLLLASGGRGQECLSTPCNTQTAPATEIHPAYSPPPSSLSRPN